MKPRSSQLMLCRVIQQQRQRHRYHHLSNNINNGLTRKRIVSVGGTIGSNHIIVRRNNETTTTSSTATHIMTNTSLTRSFTTSQLMMTMMNGTNLIPTIDLLHSWQRHHNDPPLHHRQQHKQQQQYSFRRCISSSTTNNHNDDDDGGGNVDGPSLLTPPSSSSSSSSYDNGTNKPKLFAVVYHGHIYEATMLGRHGQQLALARLEGIGKDDLPFNPFIDESYDVFDDDDDDDDDDDNDDDDNDDEVDYIYDDKEDGQSVTNTSEKNNDDPTYTGGGYDPDDDDLHAGVEDYDEDDDGDDLFGSRYKPDGSVRRKKSVLATLRAGYPSGGLFAVIELGGIQSKVTTDDLLVLNRLQPVDHYRVGSTHTLGGDNILLVGSTHMTLVGLPTVAGAEVDVMVEEITQDAKVIVFKKRRRKHSQRKNGYRRDLTLLRVLDIRLPVEYRDHKYVGRDSVDELADGYVSTSLATPPSNFGTTTASKIEKSTEDDDDETDDHDAPQVRVAQ